MLLHSDTTHMSGQHLSLNLALSLVWKTPALIGQAMLSGIAPVCAVKPTVILP